MGVFYRLLRLVSHQRHQFTLLHDGLKLLPPLRARGHFSAEQVARGQVSVAILGHDFLTLGAFTRAGPT